MLFYVKYSGNKMVTFITDFCNLNVLCTPPRIEVFLGTSCLSQCCVVPFVYVSELFTVPKSQCNLNEHPQAVFILRQGKLLSLQLLYHQE